MTIEAVKQLPRSEKLRLMETLCEDLSRPESDYESRLRVLRETCNLDPLKTITIRDLRQRWPEAEAALQVEGEILVTRDSKPVAKLVRVSAEGPRRSRWNPAEHARWQREVSGGKLSRSDAALAAARADRPLTTRRK